MAGWESCSRFKFFCLSTVAFLVAGAAGRWSSDRAMERAYLEAGMEYREFEKHIEERKEKEAIEGAKPQNGSSDQAMNPEYLELCKEKEAIEGAKSQNGSSLKQLFRSFITLKP